MGELVQNVLRGVESARNGGTGFTELGGNSQATGNNQFLFFMKPELTAAEVRLGK